MMAEESYVVGDQTGLGHMQGMTLILTLNIMFLIFIPVGSPMVLCSFQWLNVFIWNSGNIPGGAADRTRVNIMQASIFFPVLSGYFYV